MKILQKREVVSYIFSNFFRKNTKESIKYKIPDIVDTVKWLEFSDVEKQIYDSSLLQCTVKENFLLQWCCHPLLSEEFRSEIKDTCTMQDIRNIFLTNIREKLEQEQQKNRNIRMTLEKRQQAYLENQWKGIHESIETSKRLLQESYDIIDGYIRLLTYKENAIEALSETQECLICLCDIDVSDDAILTCGHRYCHSCILQVYNETNKKCPICKKGLTLMDIRKIDNKIDNNEKPYLYPLTFFDHLVDTHGTKLANIIQYIIDLKNNIETRDDKVIIFSQWTYLLKQVGDVLNKTGILSVICMGTIHTRNKAIEKINYNDEVKVILLSTDHCASGMNLTVANHIIFLESISGTKKKVEDIENQAISRSERLGQKKNIYIMRFLIRNTIEEDKFKLRELE